MNIVSANVWLHTLEIYALHYALQLRQDIAQEFEHVKDISNTLASFKTDNPRAPVSHSDNYQYDEPTRDPDVWPPPTPVPVEHKCVAIYLS